MTRPATPGRATVKDMSRFWADVDTRDLYWHLQNAHIFTIPSRARFLLTIRNELHRRGLPLTPADDREVP